MAVTALTLGAVTPAQAQIINFEGAIVQPMPTLGVRPTEPYSEAGFTFTPAGANAAIVSSTGVTTMDGNPTDYLAFAGGNTVTLTRNGGGTFDLDSVLIGRPNFSSASQIDFTITGNSAGGGTVTQTFTGVTSAQVVTLNFANLTSATFTSTADGGMDNVTLNGAVAAVAAPEPGSIALLLTAGIPVVGIVRRRKK